MEVVACGEVGLSIDYFDSLTPRQFDNILEGYRGKEEAALKIQFELNRNIEWAITRQYLDDKNPDHPKTILEYKCFPWEIKKENLLEQRKPKTQAELEAAFAIIDKKKQQ